MYGVANAKPVNTDNLTNDLNAGIANLKKIIAENAITVLKNDDAEFFPLTSENKKTAEISPRF